MKCVDSVTRDGRSARVVEQWNMPTPLRALGLAWIPAQPSQGVPVPHQWHAWACQCHTSGKPMHTSTTPGHASATPVAKSGHGTGMLGPRLSTQGPRMGIPEPRTWLNTFTALASPRAKREATTAGATRPPRRVLCVRTHRHRHRKSRSRSRSRSRRPKAATWTCWSRAVTVTVTTHWQ